MEEALILACVFNAILLLIGHYIGVRSVVIISSVIWILVGFAFFETYQDTLLLGIMYMIAFAQVFIPLKKRS